MANEETPPAQELVETAERIRPEQVDTISDEQVMRILKAAPRPLRNQIVMLLVAFQEGWHFDIEVHKTPPRVVKVLAADLAAYQALYKGVVNLCLLVNNRQVSKFSEHVKLLGSLIGIEVK